MRSIDHHAQFGKEFKVEQISTEAVRKVFEWWKQVENQHLSAADLLCINETYEYIEQFGPLFRYGKLTVKRTNVCFIFQSLKMDPFAQHAIVDVDDDCTLTKRVNQLNNSEHCNATSRVLPS